MVSTLNSSSSSRLRTHTANRRKTDFSGTPVIWQLTGHEKGLYLGCPSKKKRLMAGQKDLKATAPLEEKCDTKDNRKCI